MFRRIIIFGWIRRFERCLYSDICKQARYAGGFEYLGAHRKIVAEKNKES
jgi:hypothetical protein